MCFRFDIRTPTLVAALLLTGVGAPHTLSAADAPSALDGPQGFDAGFRLQPQAPSFDAVWPSWRNLLGLGEASERPAGHEDLFSELGIDGMAVQFSAAVAAPEWVDLDAVSVAVGFESDLSVEFDGMRAGASASIHQGPFSLQTEIAIEDEDDASGAALFGGVSLHLDF